MKKMKKLVSIDANSLLHRAYHALPPLTTPAGEPAGAVFGFTSMLLNVLNELQPDYLAVAWDTAAPTFRHQEYTAYKAQRPKMPQDLVVQEGRVKEVLSAFNIPQFAVEGYEADDLIGTLARQALELEGGEWEEKSQTSQTSNLKPQLNSQPSTLNSQASNPEVIIVTGDLDALQLVNDRVKVYTSKRGFSDAILYGPEEVKERYGLEPGQLVDYKALRGDPSDNIPGVRGVGQKTASKLLQQYQTLENVYQNLAKLSKREQKLLREGQKSAFMSQKLARIITDVPIELDLQACVVQDYEKEQVLKVFQRLGFRSLVGKLPVHKVSDAVPSSTEKVPCGSGSVDYRLVQSRADWEKLQQELQKADVIALDTETTGTDALQAELVGVSIATGPGQAWFVPWELKDGGWRVEGGDEDREWKMEKENTKSSTLKLLSSKRVAAHNLKYDLHILRRHGININTRSIFDTMLAAHLLQGGQGRVGLKELAFNRLGITMPTLQELRDNYTVSKQTDDGIEKTDDRVQGTDTRGQKTGGGQEEGKLQPVFRSPSPEIRSQLFASNRQKSMDWSQVPLKILTAYACQDAGATYQLYQQFQKELTLPQNEKLSRLFYEVEMPLLPILAQMETAGVLVDRSYLRRVSARLAQKIDVLQKQIFQAVGHEFNLNSPKQLERVLFDQLHLPSLKNTKTQRSTDESVLQKLQGLHPVINSLLAFREAFKIKSTYVDTLPGQLDSQNRVHTQFNQAKTATGRLSSENPNLQNIPVDHSEFNVRRAFVAPPGCKLLVADYSQVELRIMAHFSQDEHLWQSFEADQDIHAATAARIFDKFIDEVAPAERKVGKTINFGILYGLSAHGLAETLNIEHIKAQSYIDQYFENYAGVRVWIEENLRQARQQGFVETLLGRRRKLPALQSGKWHARASAERMATNMPIQGTAADLIKVAMVRICEKIQKTENRRQKTDTRGQRSKDREVAREGQGQSGFSFASSGSGARFSGSPRLILQVHDELVFEVPEREVQAVGAWVKKEMEQALALKVPLKVDLKVGDNWGQLKPLNPKG